MHHTDNSKKDKDNEIVEFQYGKFFFMITRFKRINWKEYEGYAQYQYFLYTFDKRLKIIDSETTTDVFGALVIENVYPTFETLTDTLDAILSEYILVDDAIFNCLKQVEKLNPIYLGKE